RGIFSFVAFFGWWHFPAPGILQPLFWPSAEGSVILVAGMNTVLMTELRRSLPPGQIISEPEDLYTYSYDGTPVLRSLPDGVVFATSVEEVIAVLRLAAQHRTPVVTRGSG